MIVTAPPAGQIKLDWQIGMKTRRHLTWDAASFEFCTNPDKNSQMGRVTRCLYALCWTGTDRPSVLFERATIWLMTHKVLLPGCSTLERYIARLRNRVDAGHLPNSAQPGFLLGYRAEVTR